MNRPVIAFVAANLALTTPVCLPFVLTDAPSMVLMSLVPLVQ